MYIGLDNGLTRNRWQAIIWTNGGLVYWRIYASLGLNELRLPMLIWMFNEQWWWRGHGSSSVLHLTFVLDIKPVLKINGCWLPGSNVLFPKLVLLSSCCQNIMHLWLVVINSLVPGDAIWIGGARSSLNEVMACCIIAPSHDQGHNSRVSCQKGPIGHA